MLGAVFEAGVGVARVHIRGFLAAAAAACTCGCASIRYIGHKDVIVYFCY